MLRFEHQEYFIFLLAVAFLLLIYFLYWNQRKKNIRQLGDETLVNNLMPTFSKTRRHIQFSLITLALIFGIIGLANLQKAGEAQKVTQKGIDLSIALDVSNSMYAQDISPSRMEKAKLLVDKLINELGGNRMSLILFAGKSYLSVPLTSDIEALKMNLSLARPEMIPTQGTNMGEALKTSYESFNQKEAKHKAIVLITDGEDHDEEALSIAKDLSNKGIMLCTIGVGSEAGARIPLPNGEEEFKTDKEGRPVISKMNPEVLEGIAKSGNGVYIDLENIQAASKQILSQLKRIEESTYGESRFVNYESYFQYFILFSIIFLFIEYIVPSKRFGKGLKSAICVLTLLFLSPTSEAQRIDGNIYKGNQQYKKGNYSAAIDNYKKAGEKSKYKKEAKFNTGNAYYREQQSKQALKEYEFVGTHSKDKQLSASSFHNAGNIMAEQKKWQEAINFYKRSLKQNPNAQETKYNLAYAQKMLKNQQEKKNQQQQKQENKEKKNKQDQQKQEPKESNKDSQKQENKDPADKKEKEQEPKHPQPLPSKLSKDQAKKILDALSREEKNLKDKKEKQKAGVRLSEKDW